MPAMLSLSGEEAQSRHILPKKRRDNPAEAEQSRGYCKTVQSELL
jgi:hypothetical protein